MSYHSPRRQPLSLVQNKSNSTAGSSSNASTAGGASPGSLKSRKHPSISALTSLHTSPKASLETSREGRASLSFIPFTSPGASSTSSTSSTSAARRSSSETTSGKLRARATTFSASSLSTSIYPSTSSSIRSPPHPITSSSTTTSVLGPARRTRSKTLSKSQSRPVNQQQNNNNVLHTRKALSQDDRRHSCTFVENDNLQRTLDLLEQHVEEQSRRLSLSSSSNSAAAAVSPASAGCVPGSNAASPMLSAPLMQRTPTSNPVLCPGPASSLTWSNGSSAHQLPTQQLSPPVLLPPYIPPDLDLVYPTSVSNNNAQSSSTSPKQAALSPQVERLSNLINDLSLFLPRADSLSSDQVHALQNAVDSILGKTPKPSNSSAFISSATTHLGNAIRLKHDNVNNIFADDMPTFYVGAPPIMHNNAPGYPSNDTNMSALQPSQTLYDPSTPSEDTDMLGASTKSNTSSIASLERNIGGIELQVQHNPPPYESRINFASFDNDLELVPPRW